MVANELSRRQLFLRSAAGVVGLGLSATPLHPRTARAEIDPVPNARADADLLNQLLRSEFDLVATYDVMEPLIARDATTAQSERSYLTKVSSHFQAQHRLHARALQSLIETSGGRAAADEMSVTLPSALDTTLAKTLDLTKLAADKERTAAVSYAASLLHISTGAAATLVAAIGAVHAQHFTLLYLLAERFVALTAKAGAQPEQVVPASFILNVGLPGVLDFDSFAELDTLLTLGPGG
jgi:acyl-CoA synthetase (AMP-forming)/AMP-acid ligase II